MTLLAVFEWPELYKRIVNLELTGIPTEGLETRHEVFGRGTYEEAKGRSDLACVNTFSVVIHLFSSLFYTRP